MPGRKFDAGSDYRYGFNGKENDNSTGEGNLDFGARIYDPRVGVFLSTDPASNEYPAFSPYSFCAGNPIINIDADGKRIYFVPGLGYHPKYDNNPYVSGIEGAFNKYLKDYNTYSITINGSRPFKKFLGIKVKNSLMQRIPDLVFVNKFGSKPAFSVLDDIRIYNTAKSIADDMVKNPKRTDEQINFVGTSQGAVSVAQAAVFLLENPEQFGLSKDFKIDNLVLVGSPIDKDSKLYKQLEFLASEAGGKKIGRILYDDYQSKDENNNINDEVTGVGGKNRLQSFFRGIKLFKAFFKQKNEHPHLKAAADKPTEEGYNSFHEQLTQKLLKDDVH